MRNLRQQLEVAGLRRRSVPGRALLALFLLLPLTGCSATQFGRYESFGGWFAGSRDEFSAEDCAIQPDSKTFGRYLCNLSACTPAQVSYDTAKIALTPAAAVYYLLRPAGSGNEATASEAPSQK